MRGYSFVFEGVRGFNDMRKSVMWSTSSFDRFEGGIGAPLPEYSSPFSSRKLAFDITFLIAAALFRWDTLSSAGAKLPPRPPME